MDLTIDTLVKQVNTNSLLEQKATRFVLLDKGCIPRWPYKEFPELGNALDDLYFYAPEIASQLTIETLDMAKHIIDQEELRLLSIAHNESKKFLITSRGWKIARSRSGPGFVAYNAFSIICL